MALFLRELGNKSWWDKAHDEFSWLEKDDFVGDIFKSLKTTKGKLSIFVIDNEMSNLDRVIAALACGRTGLDNFDYVLVPEEQIVGNFKVCTTGGDTLDDVVNGLHRDIARLTAASVMDLAIVFRTYMNNMKRRNPSTVRQLINASISAGSLEKERIDDNLRKKLEKKKLNQ